MESRNPLFRRRVADFYSLNRFDEPRAKIEQEMDHMSEQFTGIYNHFDNLNRVITEMSTAQEDGVEQIRVSAEFAQQWAFGGSALH